MRHRRAVQRVDLDVAASPSRGRCSSAPSPVVTGPRPVATSRMSADSFCVLPSGACASMSTPVRRRRGLRDLRAGQRLDALLLEGLLELGRHRFILDRHEPRQQLDDRDLAAESAEDRRELHADGAAAQDDAATSAPPSDGSPRRW